MEAYLTGYGKAMQAMHHLRGRRCWVCEGDYADPAMLAEQTVVAENVRFGAFLPSIPRQNRVGDYVHCSCRVANAILVRLIESARKSRASALHRELRHYIETVAEGESQAAEGLDGSRCRAAGGQWDIAQAQHFLRDNNLQQSLVAIVASTSNDVVTLCGGRQILHHVAVRKLVRGVAQLHAIWRQPQLLNEDQVVQHKAACCEVRDMWLALKWRPTICATTSFGPPLWSGGGGEVGVASFFFSGEYKVQQATPTEVPGQRVGWDQADPRLIILIDRQ